MGCHLEKQRKIVAPKNIPLKREEEQVEIKQEKETDVKRKESMQDENSHDRKYDVSSRKHKLETSSDGESDADESDNNDVEKNKEIQEGNGEKYNLQSKTVLMLKTKIG